MSTAHALYSASAAERWSRCPGSIALNYGAVDRPNLSAANGTLCHRISEECLTGVGEFPAKYVGTSHRVSEFDIEFTEDMAELCETYVNYVRGIPGARLIEVRSDYSALLGIAPEKAFGTSDAVIIGDDALHVVDAKFGYIAVAAEKNKQLALYAAGLLYTLDELIGSAPDKVYLHICQPRVNKKASVVAMQRAELDCIIEPLKRAVQQAEAALAAYCIDRPESVLQFLHPSKDACRWCAAKAACPALKIMARTENTSAKVTHMSADDLAESLDRCAVLEEYIEAVRADALERSKAGARIPGYKLVHGREGNRRWKDEAAAASTLLRYVDESEVYTRKLLSPAQVDKVLKKRKISIDSKNDSAAIEVTRSDPSLALVPASDARSEWVEDLSSAFD